MMARDMDYTGKRMGRVPAGEFCDHCTTGIEGDFIRVVDAAVNQWGEQEVFIYCLDCGDDEDERRQCKTCNAALTEGYASGGEEYFCLDPEHVRFMDNISMDNNRG